MPDAASGALSGSCRSSDAWAEREHPSFDLRVLVTEWMVGRQDDPYRGVRREPPFENLWCGWVPNSQDEACRVVVCSYWIFESQHLVRSNSFATLGLPL